MNIECGLKAFEEQVTEKEFHIPPAGPRENTGAQLPGKNALDGLAANEDGDAEIYIDINRGRYVYDAKEGRYYFFSEHSWEKDFLGRSTRAIDDVIEVYAQEALRQSWQRVSMEKAGKKEDAERCMETEAALLKRIRALHTVARKENVLTLARTGADSLAIRGDEWDSDPWLLGCRNGVIDLKTGVLRPGKPEDWIRTVAPTEYPGLEASSPAWEKFITDICGDDHDLPAYLRRLLGYGITGLTNWHVYPILYGPDGRNGKGVLLETLKSTLGDLAYKARSEILLESRTQQRGAPDADTLAFRGKRVIWASETGEGRKLNASRIKELCGGDTLNARAPFGRDPVEFSPSHLLVLLTNNRPDTSASDAALWERIHLIPFNIRFIDNPQAPNERKADHDLLGKLKPEAPGILSWLVQGCLEWQKEGLNPPATVLAATAEYRKEEDAIKRFISDRCVIGTTNEVQAGPLYKEYREWAEEMGLKPMNGIIFGKEIHMRFDSYTKRHTFYTGLRLVSAETSPEG